MLLVLMLLVLKAASPLVVAIINVAITHIYYNCFLYYKKYPYLVHVSDYISFQS